ncbi:MAG: four helix bundle protein [Phycisphaerae bacterium]
MAIQTFRDLIAWQKAKDLAKQIYAASATMPDTERFGLIAQMRRAAVSVAANIAEGYGRQSLPDYIRFLRISRGSLMELQTHMIIAEELRLLRIPVALSKLSAETDRVLQALIRSLEKHNK